jgi:hypothetical protein
MTYCNHNGTCHGELVLKPFRGRVRCDRCGVVVRILEANPVTRIQAAIELHDINALEPHADADA